MTRILSAILAVAAGVSAFGQTCSIPQPLTLQQKEMVKGNWAGYYDVDGKKTEFTVSIDFQSGTEAVAISNAPLQGTADHEEYRFCGAGAFHFKKVFADGSFEFDGVPIGDRVKGTLAIVNGDHKLSGEFQMERVR